MEWIKTDIQGPLSPRSSHISALLFDRNKELELVILFGGRKGIVTSDCWAMNCTTKSWRALQVQAQPTVSSAYACDVHNRLFIFGGMVKEPNNFCASNRLWEYNHEDGSAKVLESKNNGFAPQSLISAAMVYNAGFLYLFGGMDHNGNASNQLYRYDLNNNVWLILNTHNPPPGRFGHSMNLWVKKKFHDQSKEYFLMIYGGCLGRDMDMQISGDLIFYCIGMIYFSYY
jgi:hypothetical protein